MALPYYYGTAKKKQKKSGSGACERLKIISDRRFLLRDNFFLESCFILLSISVGRSNIAACGMSSGRESVFVHFFDAKGKTERKKRPMVPDLLVPATFP
jgi:hypothetical protein